MNPILVRSILATLLLLGSRTAVAQSGIPLLTPQNKSEWYAWFPSAPDSGNIWPDEIKLRTDGISHTLHILDVPVTTENKEFGYLATKNGMRNYELILDYQWGAKKFPPRTNLKRDSGILYHQFGPDAIWPSSVECQIQEGDTGDFYLLWQGVTPRIDTTVVNPSAATMVYKEGGIPITNWRKSVRRNTQRDTLTGWNEVRVRVEGSSGEHIVNQITNNAGWNFKRPDYSVLDEGKIALQVEGAEILYRNVEVRPLSWPQAHDPFKVLVFSKTAGFRHSTIGVGVAAIQRLGATFGFGVDSSEDASVFTTSNLSQYRAVIFLSTTGDVLDAQQQSAFQAYIRAGGGFAGIHAASDTEHDWPWYGKLVGARFSGHPQPQTAKLVLENRNSPSTFSLPGTWTRFDEWYNFTTLPTGVEPLISIDETSYTGGSMGANHPMSWQHTFEGGRVWYTALGHTAASYSEPLFLIHLLGGIQYAARLPDPTTSVSIFSGTVGGSNPSKLVEMGVFTGATLSLRGIHRSAFRVNTFNPSTGTASIGFVPGTIGIKEAELVVLDQSGFVVSRRELRGLAARGYEGTNEPTLANVLKVLGHRVDIGWTTLANNTLPHPEGEELLAKTFVVSPNSTPSLELAARYSPVGTVHVGAVSGEPGALNHTILGTADGVAPSHQMLQPPFFRNASAFPSGNFKLFVDVVGKGQRFYTDDALNTGSVTHRFRVYPMRNSGGEVIKDSWIVTMEEAGNGDYQDLVLLLRGVRVVD